MKRIPYVALVIIFLAVSGIHSCGWLPEKKDTAKTPEPSPDLSHIPSDWDGTGDWSGSSWEVKEP